MSHLPIHDLKEKIKKLESQVFFEQKRVIDLKQDRDDLTAKLEHFKYLEELNNTFQKALHFPEVHAYSLLRVRDVTSNASGYVLVSYQIRGTQIIGMKLGEALNLRQSAVDTFKIAVGNDIMLHLNERLVDIEWDTESNQYKIIPKAENQ